MYNLIRTRLVRRHLCTASLLLLVLSKPAIAELQTTQPAPPALSAWVSGVLAEHPRLREQAATVTAERARLTGASRPIYNPELEIEYERTDINLGTVALNQAIDLHGKRGARTKLADASLRVELLRYQARREELAAELLRSLVDYQAAQVSLKASQRVIEVLQRFAALAEERNRSGDVGKLEVEVAQLAYLEATINATAEHQAVLATQSEIRSLVGELPPEISLGELPPTLLPRPKSGGEVLWTHPAIQVARAKARAAFMGIQHADVERLEDPSIGIRGGREGKENLLGLRLVVPLQFRNSRKAEVEAAKAQSDQAAETYLALERQLVGKLDGAGERYRTAKSAWTLWRTRGAARVSEQLRLLETLWRSGEQTTAEYLVQVQQVISSERTAATLKAELWAAWADWLAASGKVQAWLQIEKETDQ